MASYTISPIWGAGAQLFDNSGNVLTGGKIYTYLAGTTTPATTYATPIGTVANSNPIVTNAAGRLTNEIWFPVSGSYKFVLKDANDVLIATYDNIPTTPQPPIVNDALSISYDTGYIVNAGNFTIGEMYRIDTVGTTDFVAIGASGNVNGILFTATGVGSGTGTAEYVRTVENKLRETVSVKDFGAVGDGVTDDTAAINAAMTYAIANDKVIIFDFDATIRVPTDAPTLQNAIDHAATAYLTNSLNIEIQTGHQPASGIYVNNGDYSMFTVTSVDPFVTLSASFPNTDAFILGEDAVLPNLGTLINMNGRGVAGYYVRQNSSGRVLADCGIYGLGTGGSFGIQAPGFFANGNCMLYAAGTKSYNNPRNVWITRNSQFIGEESDFSGATGDIAIYGSRESEIHIPACDVTNSADAALVLRRSWATADASDFSFSGSSAVTLERTSSCSMSDRDGVKPKINSATTDGVRISQGSCFHFLNGEIDNNGRDGLGVSESSIVSIVGSTITGNGRYGLGCRGTSNLQVSTCTVTGNTTENINIGQGGFVSLTSVTTDAGVQTKSIANITEVWPGPTSVIWTSGAGSPEGVVTAARGSLYTRTDGGVGTTLYVKEGSGSTGWAAK